MKPDLIFILENADWPAFLIEEGGTIRRANQLAILVFGSAIEGQSPLLGSIWSPENELSAEKFVDQLNRSQGGSSTLKFRLQGQVTTKFITHVCPVSRDEQKYFLFQLFNESEKPKPVPEASAPAMDANAAHKQKLDCALQLARTVSLDFNNALTSILGHTSLLLSKIEPNHPWRSSLVEVEKSASKAAEIANDLAAFSREEKDAKVQMAGNLNVLLQRTVDLFRTGEFSKIDWTLQLERKLLSANFDEAKMQQAFVKIFENAVQALKAEGPVTVQTRNLELTEPMEDKMAKLGPGNYVCIEISDSGPGIAPEILPRIFEPFFTTKGSGHRGLGLAWVYGIITNHGGGVAVSSQPGVGASVRVYLPATKKIVKQTAVTNDDLTGTQTILIVDDEDLLLTMGQMILSSFGYTVLTANSGQKALEIFSNKDNKIDLVITDLVMPNMSGRELMEHIRKISADTRIICSSGYVRSGNSDEHEAYLQKPFTSQDLLRKVKQSLAE